MKIWIKSIITLLLVFHVFTWVANGQGTISAGSCRKVITPESLEDIYLAGYDINRPAEGIHDDIYVNCIHLDNGAQKITVLSFDLIGMLPNRVKEIKDRLAENGFLPQHVIVCCTHNHEAPDTLGLWGPNLFSSGINPEYFAFVIDQAVQAALEAENTAQEAVIKTASNVIPELSRDSRPPYIVDEEVLVLAAETPEGLPIGTLINYGSHPEVLGAANQEITADYCQWVYEYMDSHFVGNTVFISGALGGLISPRVSGHTWEEAERVGHTIGQYAMEALENAFVLESPDLQILTKTILIPNRNPLFWAASTYGLIELELIRLYYASHIGIELCVFQLDDQLRFATLPGELFPEIGLVIKQDMRCTYPFLIGLGNAEMGYLVDPDNYDYPSNAASSGEHYEESLSPGWDAVPVLMKNISELIDTLDPEKAGGSKYGRTTSPLPNLKN